MRMRHALWPGLVIVAGLAGCGGPGLPKLPILPLSEIAGLSVQPDPHETTLSVSGTPTGVFTQLARGALGCWFAADGPLKASHLYRAEADPPAKGGDARIVIYERDPSMRDQRGRLAYRIDVTASAAGVRVAAMPSKFEAKAAQAMARDVESWARGGEDCHLRTAMPPRATPVPAKVAKGRALARSKR